MRARWDLSVDWISIGSGLGGCAAAVAAADAGMEALIVEKSDLLGGSTTYSYGILWVPNNHLQRRQGVEDSRERARQYMTYLGAERQWEAHVEAYLQFAPLALEYFERVGDIRFYPVRGLPDHYFPVAPGSLQFGRNVQVEPFPAATLGEWQPSLRHSPYVERVTFEEIANWGGMGNQPNWDRSVLAERERDDLRTYGAGLAGYFVRAALRKGVRIRTQTAAERLVVEDGRVSGLEVAQAGERLRIEARRGVHLATGAYGANPRLVNWFDETPPRATRRAPGSAQGDGLVLAMEQGAAIHIQHGTLAVHLAYTVPGEMAEGVPAGREASIREVAAPHSILVNRAGVRFADESNFEHVAIKQRDFDLWRHRYTNRPCFLIFDQQFWNSYGLGPVPPGGEPPEWLPRGDSVPELAAQLEIDGEQLARTIERFNGFVGRGEDQDFHRGEGVWIRQVTGDLSQRKNPNLGSVDQPPFYGLALYPTDTRSAGLVTNEHGQVLHVRGDVIPGLSACGEVAAQLHVGVGYQAGYTLTGAMAFAYRAVQQAAARQ